MSRREARGGYDNLGDAVVTAVRNTFRDSSALEPVPESVRIDGKVCLVTGANRGLGKAVAIDLARRGGRVIMACRSGHPGAEAEVKRHSALSETRCTYCSTDALDGWLTPLAVISFGAIVRRGFNDVGNALKQRAEARYAELGA